MQWIDQLQQAGVLSTNYNASKDTGLSCDQVKVKELGIQVVSVVMLYIEWMVGSKVLVICSRFQCTVLGAILRVPRGKYYTVVPMYWAVGSKVWIGGFQCMGQMGSKVKLDR